MLSSLGILTISFLIAIYELPPLWRKKLIKESIVFCFLLSLGNLMTILLSFGVQIPNPLIWIITFIKPITNFFDHFLS